jgi:(p)ppGpp synthase/HD superfamily hydrolase
MRTERQEKLLDFVKKQHEGQIRKYTGEPYWHHVVAVSELASRYEKAEFTTEIALCHDLFEDTVCQYDCLYNHLLSIGYNLREASEICVGVESLTDKYTKENYPSTNRKNRKDMEAQRLGGNIPFIQSIKYADLINNTSSIVEHDPNFAKTYLEEKRNVLQHMRQGNVDLLILCAASLDRGRRKLTELDESYNMDRVPCAAYSDTFDCIAP